MSIVHSTRITAGFITASNVAAVSRTRTAITNANILLLFNGNVSTTVFTDSSPDVRTITTVGNSTTSNTQTKFGNVLFVDGNGDYLSWTANTAFSHGSSSHTTEVWFYKTANVTSAVWSLDNTTTSGGYAGNQLAIRDDGSAIWLTSQSTSGWINTANVAVAGTFTNNVWTHLACVRNGSDFSVYKDGNRVGGYTSSTAISNNNQTSYLGARRNGASFELYFTGYLTNFRFVRGAVYTANFTPSTSALSANNITIASTVNNAVYGMRKNY